MGEFQIKRNVGSSSEDTTSSRFHRELDNSWLTDSSGQSRPTSSPIEEIKTNVALETLKNFFGVGKDRSSTALDTVKSVGNLVKKTAKTTYQNVKDMPKGVETAVVAPILFKKQDELDAENTAKQTALLKKYRKTGNVQYLNQAKKFSTSKDLLTEYNPKIAEEDYAKRVGGTFFDVATAPLGGAEVVGGVVKGAAKLGTKGAAKLTAKEIAEIAETRAIEGAAFGGVRAKSTGEDSKNIAMQAGAGAAFGGLLGAAEKPISRYLSKRGARVAEDAINPAEGTNVILPANNPVESKPITTEVKKFKVAESEPDLIRQRKAATDSYGSIGTTDLTGAGKENAGQRVLEAQWETPQGKALAQKDLGEKISSGKIKPNADGTITVYRGGEPADNVKLVSVSTDRKAAEAFGDVKEYRVSKNDIAVAKGLDSDELLIDRVAMREPVQPNEVATQPTDALSNEARKYANADDFAKNMLEKNPLPETKGQIRARQISEEIGNLKQKYLRKESTPADETRFIALQKELEKTDSRDELSKLLGDDYNLESSTKKLKDVWNNSRPLSTSKPGATSPSNLDDIVEISDSARRAKQAELIANLEDAPKVEKPAEIIDRMLSDATGGRTAVYEATVDAYNTANSIVDGRLEEFRKLIKTESRKENWDPSKISGFDEYTEALREARGNYDLTDNDLLDLINAAPTRGDIAKLRPKDYTTSTADIKKGAKKTFRANQPISGRGKKVTSGYYERLKSALQDEMAIDGTYKPMNLERDAKRAVDLGEKDFDKAVRVALGYEQPPAGITDTAISRMVMARAIDSGDKELLVDVSNSLIRKARRKGQEVVAFRGTFGDTDAITYVKHATSEKTNEAIKRYGSREKLDSAVDKEVSKLASEMRKSNILNIGKAQSIIDNLTCK